MITRVSRDEATLIALPGRTLHAYLRPDPDANPPFSTHVAVFPPGSRPEGHVHATETEAVYVIRGRGRIVTPDGTAELEPGVFVLIDPGTRHATESGPDEELELYCVFSPPVVLGSYEPATDSSR
jgi:quercetin dioxygenase-like cupin family protein